jgi:NAD(P)-dependent dehydrogenase (short-subunit alcohol dehydrogenase family)
MSGVLLVTGGSRGIGAATARLAARRGYAVCVNYVRNGDAAASVVDLITSEGGRAVAVRADVSREPEVQRLFAEMDATFGPVTALVNNAGILEPQMRVEEMTAERLNRVFTTNVTSYFLCAREAVRRMSTRRGGSPEEVARAILWLLSDEASYSTGTFIDISGGK